MKRRALAAAGVVVVLTAGCTGGDDAGPSPTTDATTPTSVVDLSGVVLAPVPGETTSTIDETGSARLVGSVRGPAGPLAGATVRIERILIGRGVARDVVTGPDGRWELRDVPGGRYRVRAFLAPSFAQTTAEVRFLADREEHVFDLSVEEHGGLVVRADAAPDQPSVGAPVNLVVLVAERSVDADGVVGSTPLVGLTVELGGLGRWVLRDDADPSSGSTARSAVAVRLSDGGRGRVELRCVAAGAPGLVLRVPRAAPAPGPTTTLVPGAADTTVPPVVIETVALDLPACADVAAGPATSTTVADPSTTSTSSTTEP